MRFALGAISFHVLHHFDKVDVVLIDIGLVLLLTFLQQLPVDNAMSVELGLLDEGSYL